MKSSSSPGLNLPTGRPETSIGFSSLGLRGAAPRARDRERTRARDVRRSIFGSNNRKKDRKADERELAQKSSGAAPLHQENTCSLHRRAIFLTKFIARNGVIRRFVIERISRPVGDSCSDGALMDSGPASCVLNGLVRGVYRNLIDTEKCPPL